MESQRWRHLLSFPQVWNVSQSRWNCLWYFIGGTNDLLGLRLFSGHSLGIGFGLMPGCRMREMGSFTSETLSLASRSVRGWMGPLTPPAIQTDDWTWKAGVFVSLPEGSGNVSKTQDLLVWRRRNVETCCWGRKKRAEAADYTVRRKN